MLTVTSAILQSITPKYSPVLTTSSHHCVFQTIKPYSVSDNAVDLFYCAFILQTDQTTNIVVVKDTTSDYL